MRTPVGPARIGQWYMRADKGETFQVTGRDLAAQTIEVQSFHGDLDEIDEESWTTLPLELAEQPEDWTGPVDDVERDDLGYSETEMTGTDLSAPLQALQGGENEDAWQDTTPEDEDPQAEAAPEEELILDDPSDGRRLG